MDENSVLLLVFVFGFLLLGGLFIAWKAFEWKLIFWILAAPFWVAWKLLSITGLIGSRALLRVGSRSPRMRNPEDAIEVRKKVIPARVKGKETLRNGLHFTCGGNVEAVHKLIVAMSGAAKNQADFNFEVQHQLRFSNEHIIAFDPKPNGPISKIVYAEARPEDRIFSLTFHPRDRYSSALRLFRDPGELNDLAYMLTDEPGEKDSHWNAKAAEAIAAVAVALTQLKSEANRAAARFAGEDEDDRPTEITATLNEVRDVIADRRRLEELKEISPIVDNVADVSKEWGFIRSTASRRLSALANLETRRVFAGGPDEVQADFSRRDGRDIVIFRPYPRSAKRLQRFVYAGLDAVYRSAADGGDAGGPGTKVLIDEAASYMSLANLGEYLDLGRESKVQLTYVLQGTKQLAAKLGEKEAEAVIRSTEVKVVGKTDDDETAKMISELSPPVTAQYRRPAGKDEILGEWGERERRLIEPYEITSQNEGEFTCQQGGRVWKVQVPKNAYHFTQAGPPREHRLYGVADPQTYKVPPILAPDEEEIPAEEYGETLADDVPDLEDAPGDLVDPAKDSEGGEWLD